MLRTQPSVVKPQLGTNFDSFGEACDFCNLCLCENGFGVREKLGQRTCGRAGVHAARTVLKGKDDSLAGGHTGTVQDKVTVGRVPAAPSNPRRRLPQGQGHLSAAPSTTSAAATPAPSWTRVRPCSRSSVVCLAGGHTTTVQDKGKAVTLLLHRLPRRATLVFTARSQQGKSALRDSLVAGARIFAQEAADDVCIPDTCADGEDAGITVKSTGISLSYEMSDESLTLYNGERDGNEYLINLIDCPGHNDFSSEVRAALRITDGALVVVDCIEGIGLQTETVLRQALGERIRPVLTVNKVDRCFLELQIDGEEAYQIFSNVIQNANGIMETYDDKVLGDVMVCPENGSVVFSDGLHGWAFTLANFAKMYASKFGVDEPKTMKRLWGENFFDPETKKWTSKHTGSVTCKRGFVRFCYEPIKLIINTCMNDQKDKLWPLLQKLGLTMTNDEKGLTGEALMRHVMQKWLPASRALVETIVYHLPSPSKAQKYRVENLYDGPINDEYATAIMNCDPEGPLMLYVSKMIPASGKGRFFAFGRVFSGKVATGHNVRIMGPNYASDHNKDLCVKSVQRIAIWMANKLETVEEVPCGNTVAIAGLDESIAKNATLTNEKSVDVCPILALKFSMPPVVRVSVDCKVPSDTPKLLKGLKSLEISDLMVRCTVEESGQPVIAGAGELHLQVCLEDLKKYFVDGAEITVSPFEIVFCETVLALSERDVKCKFKSNHNYLSMRAHPLENEVLEEIDCGRFNPHDTSAASSKFLSEKLNWGEGGMENIWCFGPDTTGPNMLTDTCKGLTNEIKTSVFSGFRLASKKGVLADQEMRGISFVVSNVVLHADANQRGLDRVASAAQRATLASQLLAKPRLLEPVYLVQILVPEKALNAVYCVLNEKGVEVVEEKKIQRFGNLLYIIKGRLPIQDSLGFSKALSDATSKKAASLLMFDNHWEMMYSDPLNAQSPAADHVNRIRRRKGLNPKISTLSDLEDLPA
ncbi:unnamed protein product [Alopecurus aequalis]